MKEKMGSTVSEMADEITKGHQTPKGWSQVLVEHFQVVLT